MQAPTLPLALPVLDYKVYKKHIECLSNITFAMDAQALAMNKSKTKSASDQKGLTLDRLKNSLLISLQKDYISSET